MVVALGLWWNGTQGFTHYPQGVRTMGSVNTTVMSPWAGFCASCEWLPHRMNAPLLPLCRGLVTIRASLGWGHSGVTSCPHVPLSSLFPPHPRASQSRSEVVGLVIWWWTVVWGLEEWMAIPVANLQKVRKTDVIPGLLLWTGGRMYSIKWQAA